MDVVRLRIEALFLAHRGSVYRWAYGLCRDHADALDVVQEVFMKLLREPPALDHPLQTMSLLRLVTVRTLIDRWRATAARREAEDRRQQQPELASSDSASAAPAEERERAAHIRAAIESLSEQQRLVVVAKCFDGLTFAQVAAELKIAVPTAKTHYVRALAALRDRLQPFSEGADHALHAISRTSR